MKTVLLLVMILVQTSISAEPPSNSIPVIVQRLMPGRWSELLLCQLTWTHIDGFEFELALDQTGNHPGFLEAAAACGLIFIVTPSEFHELAHLGEGSRAHLTSLTSNSAFFETDNLGAGIEETYTASEMQAQLESLAADLVDAYSDHEAFWCWKLMDEVPTAQRLRMYDEDTEYDEYFPNMFPCQTADSSMLVTDSASVYSWMKWIIEHEDEEHPVTTVFAGMPYISNWAWFTHEPGVPTADVHANIVRAYAGMRYQDYPLVYPSVHDNFPEMLQVDIYPFRQVGTGYQDSMSYTPVIGDMLYTWLFDHAETGMDSTFLPALNNGLALHYFPQAFGMAGGEGEGALWRYDDEDSAYVLDYLSYRYRIPTPFEFRMLCNVALMHQAKGIFPYSLMSYPEGNWFSAALLDEDLVPWDAPFEDYCYRTRAQDSITYTRPDYYPPFMVGFDPLYEGPGPEPDNPGERQRESSLEWKFAPYGRLWNSLRETMAGIAIMAPELAELSWLEEDGRPDEFLVIPDVEHSMSPGKRVFVDDHYYMFYVNRCCADSLHSYEVKYYAGSELPAPNGYLLDHTRRFLVQLWEYDNDYYGYLDTLRPGEARLMEIIDEEEDADLRITSPDVYCRYSQSLTDRHEFDYTAGDTVEAYGTFYNLGTEGAEDVEVVLYDLTDSVVLGRDTLDFAGLDSFGVTDDATASFVWITDPGDIGIHLLEIEAEQVGSEDSRDNAVSVPFLIEPRDYATEVRDDPWDMMEEEVDSLRPDWKTNDIEAIDGLQRYWLSSAWTDSVGGMFEGALDPEAETNPNGIPAKLSLAIPTQSGRWIDSDEYCILSFAGVWQSDWHTANSYCPTYVAWKDSNGQMSQWYDISGIAEEPSIRNGWTTFHTSGPIDLRRLANPDPWSGDLMQELWLKFEPVAPTVSSDPIQIRLSWVRLLEEPVE
jgi:hypothetical protein